VIKAFWLSVVVVFVAGISFEVVNGMGHSFEIVLNDYVETAINFLFNKIF
jgi:hypothetical protein